MTINSGIKYSLLTRFIALTGIVISLVVLCGWVFNLNIVLNLIPGAATMKFNTALMFFFTSTSLFFIHKKKYWYKPINIFFATILVIVGILTLIEYEFDLNLGVDNLIIQDNVSPQYPGRMSAATAFSFLLIGLSLFILYSGKRNFINVAQALLLFVSLLALISLDAYLLDVPITRRLFFFNTMAVHTSFLFLILSFGLTLKEPDYGLTGLITGKFAGSTLIRLLIPFIIIVPLFLSYLVLTYAKGVNLDRDFALAIFSVLFILITGVYAVLLAIRLNRTDVKRIELEEELKQTNLELKRHWQSLIEHTPDLIARLDKDYRYTYVNEKVTSEKLGIDASMLIGKTPADLGYPKENVKNYYAMLEKVFNGQKADYFSDVKLPDGEISLYTVIVPEHNEKGEITHALSITRDVTQLKQTENELIETKNFLETLVTHIPDGIARLDREGRFTFVNDVKLSRMHVDKKDVIGKKSNEFPLPEFKEITRVFQETVKDKEQKELVIEISENDARFILFIPEVNRKAEIESVLLISRDITKLLQSQKELKRSEELWKSVFNNAPVIIVRLNKDFTYESVNPAVQKQLKIDPAQMVGKSIHEIGFPKHVTEDFEKYLTMAAKTQMVKNYEFSYNMNNKTRHGIAHIVPELDQKGNTTNFLVMITDLSRVKETEHKLRQQKMTLEHLNRELEAFTYTVSHDLRSPLRAILGFNEKLKASLGDTIDNSQMHYINVIKKNTSRMANLIDELLNLTRIDKLEMKKSRVNLKPMIQEVSKELQEQTKKVIQLSISRELPKVSVDRNLFRQVVFNILSNAVKYSKENENVTIEVSGEKYDNEVILEFKDLGIGFDPRFKNKIFEVFQRLHAQNEYSGVGVGLSIADRIVKKHGGKIWAVSEPEKFTSFFIELPVKQL